MKAQRLIATIGFVTISVLIGSPLAALPTPGRECRGFTGTALNVCTTYCRILACPSHPGARACQLLRGRFEFEFGSELFACMGRARVPTPTATPSPTPTPTPTPPDFTCPAPADPDDILPGVVEFEPSECDDGEPGRVAEPGSILVFPNVRTDPGDDVVLHVSNASNLEVHAECFYAGLLPANPSEVPSSQNPIDVGQIRFSLTLSPHQPVHWLVSTGRASMGTPSDSLIARPLAYFLGEVKCIQVDESGAPIAGNALSGTATILRPGLDVAKYDGITISGLPSTDSDRELRLDGDEYGRCPNELRFNLRSDGAPDTVLGKGSRVESRLTLVPCTENFATGEQPRVTVLVRAVDEFELQLSGQFTLEYWIERYLNELSPAFAGVGSTFQYIELSRPTGNYCSAGPNRGASCSADIECKGRPCRPYPGLLGVLESIHTDTFGRSASAMHNLQTCGAAPPSFITLPPAID